MTHARASRGRALFVVAAASLALAGCIAQIDEERIFGPPRPSLGGPPIVVEEQRPAPAGSPDGTSGPEVALPTAECREVTIESRVQDVTVRRSFADRSPFGPQATNVGLATLLGAGAAFVGFDLGTLACFQNNDKGCSGQTGPSEALAEKVLVGLAVIPLGFAVYNAIRVQDRSLVRRMAPGATAGPWRPCVPTP